MKDLEPFGTAAGTGSPEGQAALLNNHVPDDGDVMKMNEQSKGELVACLLSMSKPSSKKWPSYHERREEEEAHDGIRQIFLGETLITTCSGTTQVRMDQIKKCNVFYGRDCT